MKRLQALSALTLGLCALAVPSTAQAATLVGGETRVQVTADLAALGLTPGVLGSASIVSGSPLTVAFPITGGTLDASLAGSILHEGSGVSLTAGANTLALTNFIIDTVGQRILGDAALNGASLATDLPIFTFNLASVTPAQLTNLAAPALSLRISSEAAGALTTVFGAPNLAGAEFGLAATAPAVPEPGTWAMMISGFGLVGLALRKRRTAVMARA